MIFVSSRTRRSEQDNRENFQTNRTSNSIQISVPCELVMDLLSQGAILQLQMGPVPLRSDLARPGPRPERPDPTNARPEAKASNIRPNNVTDDSSSRPNPSGSSENDVPRPERPKSRGQPITPVSPFTDWSSLADNEVISIPSEDDDDYVPRSPVYEPDSPGPVVEPEDQNPGPNNHESGPSRTIFSNVSREANEERHRSPLGRGTLLQRVPPF